MIYTPTITISIVSKEDMLLYALCLTFLKAALIETNPNIVTTNSTLSS